MFQGHNHENTTNNNSEKNRKKVFKKSHCSPKRKHHLRHSRKKRWESKFNNLNLKSSEYTSDYIGPNRLTNHMGFLAKGKMSDSISRLEEIVPDNLKARTKQDLHRILEASNHTTTQSSIELEQIGKRGLQNYSSDENISSPIPVRNSSKGASKKKSDRMSTQFDIKETVPSSKESAPIESPEHSHEIAICREVITKKLHPRVASVNALVFPNSSNQTKLINELLIIKSQYESARRTASNSSNCESSPDSYSPEIIESSSTRNVTDRFELNPVLTQETGSPKRLQNLFPNRHVSSPESDEIYIEAEHLIRNKLNTDFNEHMRFENKSSSPGSECSTSLMLGSPGIPSKSNWMHGKPIPDLSPVKFIPDIPPTPKLYYRQKMF